MAQKQKRGNPDRHKPETRAAWLEGQRLIQLRMPSAMKEQMQRYARGEVMSLAGWIRFVCVQELRRKKVAA